MTAMGRRVLATLLCTAGVAVGSKVKTLSQYDQVRAEVNGTLDVDMLTEWLEDSHANTMSFLLWDTDGHQYLDMVRFLEATKDRQGAAKIEVWVTLIPPSETEQWVNKSDCGRCPPDRPHPYGSATSGTYCCDNATATKVDHCDSKTPECCVAPGSVLGCQGIPRCGNNPENKTACGSGDPGLPAGTSLCSIPSDSPLTPFNESELVDFTQGYRGCNDYVGWGRILNKLAAQYPNVVTVNIDDFVDSLVHVFNQSYVSKIYAALHGADGPGVSLIPTYYYGSKANFVMTENPWLAHATDGVLFYYMNMKGGQAVCSTGCSPLPPSDCPFPCLFDTCAENSLPSGLEDEINDFATLLPASHPIHVGLYFTGYGSCIPSEQWGYTALKTVLSMPSVSGATVYTFERGPGPSPRSPGKCAPVAKGEVPKGKGCIVADLFAEFGGEEPALGLA